MSVRVRALFYASLALVAGQLALPGRGTAGASEAAAPVVQRVQPQHEAHPSSGARGWLPDRPVDRLADAALGAPRAAGLPLSPASVTAAARPSGSGPSDLALLLLPPSRAPPALS